MNDITELLKLPETVVIDVRTPAEFTDAHLTGSINIPLSELEGRLDEFKNMKHIVICCASGIRSKKASMVLKQHQIDCFDGGSWLNVYNYLNN